MSKLMEVCMATNTYGFVFVGSPRDMKGSFVGQDCTDSSGGVTGSWLDAGFSFAGREVTSTFAIDATAVITYTEGAATLSIGTGTNTGTLKAGQVLNAVGVNTVDIYGVSTGKPYAITVLEDVTFAANAATVKVKPMYFTAGPNKNVSATPNAKVVSSVHASATSYQSVLIWDKQSFITASAKLKGLAVSEKKGASGKVMNSLLQVTSDGLKGIDILRWDVLVGFAIARTNWVSRVDVKLS
jgi:hypothetical protein